MTALDRNAITRGPGCFFWNPGASQIAIPGKSGIEADVVPKEIEIKNDADGTIDRRLVDCEAKISWTPLGLLTADVFNVLYPAAYRSPVKGASAFGASDTPALVHSIAGQKVTFHSVAVTRMPQLVLSHDKEVFGGAAEVTAIRGTGLEWSNAAALYTIAAGAYSAPAVASANVVTQPYTAAWGDVWASIVAEAGWTIDFDLKLTPDPVDGYGTNDYLIDEVGVIAKCRPKNLSETIIDELEVQGAGVSMGMSRRRGKNLVITGTGLVVTLYDAILQRGPCIWRGVEVRPGEVAFAASRSETAGVYGALFGFSFA